MTAGGGYVPENGISLCEECHEKAESFHRGEPVPPGFTPAELYGLIGSSEEEGRTASEELLRGVENLRRTYSGTSCVLRTYAKRGLRDLREGRPP